MSAAEAIEQLDSDEWAGWVRSLTGCCPQWPHTDHPDEVRAVAAGWVPVSAGWHRALWVHPDHPHVARVGRHRT